MLFLLGLLLATMIHSFICFVASYIVGNAMGFQLNYVRFYFWDISEMNGEFTCTTRKFNPLWQHAMYKKGITEKEDVKHANLSLVVNAFVTIALATICIAFGYEDFALGDETLGGLLMGLGIGFTFHIIVYIGIQMIFMLTRKTRLMAYNKKIIHDFANGYPIEYMNLPPLETMNLKGSKYEKHVYQGFRFIQKVSQGAYYELMPIVMWYENNFEDNLLKYETGSYYNVIFYYSYINPDLMKATKYFNSIRDELLNDTDSNGRRVLAYYQLCVMNDPISARQTAQDGLKVISHFSICDAERAYEANLLNNILSMIVS